MEDSDRKQVVRAPGSVQARGLSLSPNLGKIGIRNGVCSSGFSWRSVSNRKGKPRSPARNQAESKDRERPFLCHPATPVVPQGRRRGPTAVPARACARSQGLWGVAQSSEQVRDLAQGSEPKNAPSDGKELNSRMSLQPWPEEPCLS